MNSAEVADLQHYPPRYFEPQNIVDTENPKMLISLEECDTSKTNRTLQG